MQSWNWAAPMTHANKFASATLIRRNWWSNGQSVWNSIDLSHSTLINVLHQRILDGSHRRQLTLYRKRWFNNWRRKDDFDVRKKGFRWNEKVNWVDRYSQANEMYLRSVKRAPEKTESNRRVKNPVPIHLQSQWIICHAEQSTRAESLPIFSCRSPTRCHPIDL